MINSLNNFFSCFLVSLLNKMNAVNEKNASDMFFFHPYNLKGEVLEICMLAFHHYFYTVQGKKALRLDIFGFVTAEAL